VIQPRAMYDFGRLELTLWSDAKVWSIVPTPYGWVFNLGYLSALVRRKERR
jgi:hypothetical protein